ncbi:peroxisomal membrane protein 11B isoform X2 [Benincasa hispida]|uniref:peroxisomal membrane protein 11B isoform X2 n=1 Tax=Benincasa hispida TaxID=102211 RepID=UPI0018FF5478|nr:peroxisomal membrane protein 11B isoform X2 [Benincasa hispida]
MNQKPLNFSAKNSAATHLLGFKQQPSTMTDTVDKLVIFLAKRDGIDKLVKTFQYVSKLVHWHLETSHPDKATRAKNWEVASGLSRKAFRTGRFLTGFNALRRSPGSTPTFRFLAVLANAGIEAERKLRSSEEDSKEERVNKINGDRIMRLMAVAANVADLIIGLAEIEPNPFCNHTITLGISGLVSAWAGWYRNWPS